MFYRLSTVRILCDVIDHIHATSLTWPWCGRNDLHRYRRFAVNVRQSPPHQPRRLQTLLEIVFAVDRRRKAKKEAASIVPPKQNEEHTYYNGKYEDSEHLLSSTKPTQINQRCSVGPRIPEKPDLLDRDSHF